MKIEKSEDDEANDDDNASAITDSSGFFVSQSERQEDDHHDDDEVEDPDRTQFMRNAIKVESSDEDHEEAIDQGDQLSDIQPFEQPGDESVENGSNEAASVRASNSTATFDTIAEERELELKLRRARLEREEVELELRLMELRRNASG